VTVAPGGVKGAVQMASSATVSPTLLGVLGIGAVTVNGTATAVAAASGLELAMVLDNTGSMVGSSMTALKLATTNLLDALYGTGNDTQPNLWVSVVPFTAAVNIGATHANWLVGGAIDQTPYMPSKWMGCVMARTAATGAQDGDDSNDKTPSQAPMKPFLYQSTYHVYKIISKGTTYYYTGDNDWTVSPNNISEPDDADKSGNNTVGPNLDCPSLAILPETASRTIVSNTSSHMVAVSRGGTFINLGLQAGWWTLSPNWKGLWGDANLPLAYNTPYMKKAIVLMTDGNNEWYDWAGGVPGSGPTQTTPSGGPAWNSDGDADFTAYGRLKSNTLGLAASQASITATLNTWMSQMCTTIKQNGIVIYTVLLNNTTPATVSLFQNCASSTSNYFNTPTGADLQAAFKQIGQDLSNLRISQ
jgi:hypothetical protein